MSQSQTQAQTLSPAAFLASLPEAEREAQIRSLTDEDREALVWHWPFWARPQQLEPEGDWQFWMFCAGRGAGKTRSGAEWCRQQIKNGKGRGALTAPTSADARDVMVEGESGLLSVCWEHDRDAKGNKMGSPVYEPSKRRVTWENGAQVSLFSAEEPERLRGPQHDFMWADELAAWKYMRDTWDMALFGLRLGDSPRAMITTTPKPVSLVRELLKDRRTVISTGSTFDNAANLAPNFLETIRERYEGTRLGRQELYAEILDEAEGALWTRSMIEQAKLHGDTPQAARIVVAVDPAITATEESDETGIVIAQKNTDGFYTVLKDYSGRYKPREWAKTVVAAFYEFGADRIVAEGNQGGDMVRHTIHTEWPEAPVSIVHASRGKAARAEPISALYEQGRVKHANGLQTLEDQMVTWEPLSGMPSPDRLDALVWAITELAISRQTRSATKTVKGLL